MSAKARTVRFLFHIDYDIAGYTKDADHNNGDCRLTVSNETKNRPLFNGSIETYRPKTGNTFYFSSEAQGEEDFSSDIITWCLKDVSVDTDGQFRVSWGAVMESDHTHEADPGLEESFDGEQLYPKNVDVIVNGTTVQLDLGDGSTQLTEQIDLSGELTSGRKNEIQLDSDSKGHIQAHMDIDVYRQIIGEG